MKSEYEILTAKYEQELLENLSKFVEINSVYDESTADEENQFGKGVSSALQFVEQLAKKDGFEVTNYKNKIVEILCGSGEKNITILAHADVVPAGTGWDQNPFSMVEKNGALYGRGVADDKGPLLASYYALKALRDAKLLGNYQVRLLVGGNEESGSLGMEYYFHTLKKKQPTLGFTPDSSFPLIFAEKGIQGFEVKYDWNIKGVKSIHAGVASNSVIERCEIEKDNDEEFIKYLDRRNIKYTLENNKLVFHGVAAHGSVPWNGVNAAMIAIDALADFYHDELLSQIVRCYSDTKGKGLNADCYSEDMFDNSLNVGLLNYENNHFSMIVNFRYVNTADMTQIMNNIVNNSKPFEVVELGRSELLYFPKDSVLVSSLMKAYQEETGDYESKPMSTGGGTYAKEADNVVAFGMEFPGFDAHMHSPGENIIKKDLLKGMAIVARAIIELGHHL